MAYHLNRKTPRSPQRLGSTYFPHHRAACLHLSSFTHVVCLPLTFLPELPRSSCYTCHICVYWFLLLMIFNSSNAVRALVYFFLHLLTVLYRFFCLTTICIATGKNNDYVGRFSLRLFWMESLGIEGSGTRTRELTSQEIRSYKRHATELHNFINSFDPRLQHCAPSARAFVRGNCGGK